ncbi:MAG: hypothetical protein M3R55_06650 [Acidobacteriota bacterium]|nr:hypothetical protein [Acidobacteriota bacterium]
MLPLPLIDGLALDDAHRSLLRPEETVVCPDGVARRLPRFFYQVDSWAQALEIRLTNNFSLWEFIDVDLYEPDLLRQYPRYVPASVTLLAAHLELFRDAVSATVHVSANGGYRSPAHRRSSPGSPHAWGTAANIYRIGGDFLDSRDRIERHNAIAARVLPGIWTRPYGHVAGHVDDHIHFDLGYVAMTPPAPLPRAAPPQA